MYLISGLGNGTEPKIIDSKPGIQKIFGTSIDAGTLIIIHYELTRHQ